MPTQVRLPSTPTPRTGTAARAREPNERNASRDSRPVERVQACAHASDPAGSVPASAGRCPLPAHGPFVPLDVPEAPELVTLLREVRDGAEPELEMERYRSRVRQRDSRDGTM